MPSLELVVVVFDSRPELDLFDLDVCVAFSWLPAPLVACSYLNFPWSINLTTGGRASGATSTRSNPVSSALSRASSMLTIPTCSPSSAMRRMGLIRIWSLTRTFCSLMGQNLRSWCHSVPISATGQQKRPGFDRALEELERANGLPILLQNPAAPHTDWGRKVGGFLPPLPIVP